MQLLESAPSPSNIHTFPVNQSWESAIDTAKDFLEQAHELEIKAGRLLATAKEQAKRKFSKQLEYIGLDKLQTNKYIKAAAVADEIPSEVAVTLGLPLLLQLGQPKNQEALAAISSRDSQVDVVLKIKEYQPAPVPRPKQAVSFVGNQKGGVGKLRIEIPGCPEAIDLANDFKASGLSPLKWLQQVLHRQDEQARAQAEFNNYIDAQAEAVAPEIIPIANEGEKLEQLGSLLVFTPGGVDVIASELAELTGDVVSHSQDSEQLVGQNSQEIVEHPYDLSTASDWEDVEKLVGRDSVKLKALTAQASPEQLHKLHEYLVDYCERTPDALAMHDIDWVPFALLEPVLKALSLEVQDVYGGLALNTWCPGCTFVSVVHFGNDEKESWEFLMPDGSPIEAYDRADVRITQF
ncbi:hypothetical protein [Fischerella sp. PCC 9605]|uniref:hypothetical protein n=1 Tax=Fischerella sp. PCC 9605 TaxID=1173024 RepID=UPI00047CF339|nr:hypothetical protein [Fischerella sp. PCC 9605]